MSTPGEKGDAPYGPTAPVLAASRPLGERHRLLVWAGEAGQSWPLPPAGEITVGRAPDVGVRIDSPTVSRQHARLSVGPRAVRIIDLGSQNGVRINGERLSGERLLAYGDIVTFGDIVAVFCELTGADEEPAPAAVAAARDEQAAALEPQRLDLGDRQVLVADAAMSHVYIQLRRLAVSDLSVLVMGETGTGKELAARALHAWSGRRARRFATINCATVPEPLGESELFGHEKGAFTGASAAKVGLFESAPGGTVFLDEIGEMPLALQAKLLRVLENRTLMRLGSVQERAVDVRVVAATNRDLLEEAKAGRFRLDLYYRLSVAEVRLPPLRARPRELPLLAAEFLAQTSAGLGRPAPVLSEGALLRLRAHDWPGNVRELKNLIDYLAATVPEATITAEHVAARLDDRARLAAAAPSGDGALPGVGVRPLAEASRDFERRSIEAALAATNGNKTRAAKLLGVPLRTFMEKVKRHGLA